MTEFQRLAKAVALLGETIADFPVGAISINDLKSTEDKIRDLRISLKQLKARRLRLRAKVEAHKTAELPEESEQDTYDQLQDAMAHCVINNIALENCLQNDASEELLENLEDNEISGTFKDIMQKMYTLNDTIIGMEQSRSKIMIMETKLKREMQASLADFGEFLKQQENLRKKKLQESNPEIARQKELMQKRVQKINIMKRLITHLIGASMHIVKDQPILQELYKKHRELLSMEMVMNMGKERHLDNS